VTADPAEPTGPLTGLRVVEFAGIGPVPHCAMLLSDLGAEVLRIERPEGQWHNPVVDRGRAVLSVDIRSSSGRETCFEATDLADVVLEGFRPGVMERRGLGPAILLERNPRLVVARLTGWGQSGPLARAAGHDINYIALTGALAAIGTKTGPSIPPLNLVGDFGGGSLYAAFGIMAALWERERSGKGQVIDVAMVDGAASLMAMVAGLAGHTPVERGRHFLGGAAPFYRCYFCADGREIAIGPIEPRFYAQMLELIGAPGEFRDGQNDINTWEPRGAHLATLFATRTRAQWCEILEGTDACFAPVLTLEESFDHAHMRDRGVYVEANGLLQVAPGPRFSRTPGTIAPTSDGQERLRRWCVQSRS